MKYLDRRAVLRGAAGGLAASIGLPILDAMLDFGGTKLANGAAVPVRYGTWWWGNGVILDHDGFKPWVPDATGTAWMPKEELAPLAGHRDQLSVITGRETYHDGEWYAHHTGRYVMMTASFGHDDTWGNCLAPSIDRLVAQAWKTPGMLESVDVAVSRRGFETYYESGSISMHGVDNGEVQWNQPTFSPDAVYDRLFQVSGPADAGDAGEALRRSRRSVLDLVLADANRLRARLGASDKQRLDRHLDAVRGIEQRLAVGNTSTATLQYPNPNAGAAARKGTVDYQSREDLVGINMLMADLVAYALAANLTRVFTFQFTGMQVDTLFPQKSEGLHTMTHDGSRQMDVHDTVVFTMQQLDYFLDRLRSYDEPGGSVLDNSCILATSEHGSGESHDTTDVPILLIGKAGGRLRGNYHHRAYGANSTDALITALRAVGLATPSLGVGACRSTQAIDELFA